MAGTVTVACKIPNGIVLRVYDFGKQMIPIMGGGAKEVAVAHERPWYHKINGPARKLGADVPYQISHGMALTHGVDADMWALWLEQNKTADFVTGGFIFAHAKPIDAVAQANEMRAEKTGAEPIDPQNLPPEFKRTIQPAGVAA